MSDALEMPEFGEAGGPALPAHLYVHVPFCSSKCSYCDFGSVANAAPEDVFAVFAGMEAEVRRWAFSALPGVVDTVYVGGGTPSLHAAPVGRLLEHVARDLPLRKGAEITAEANPDSLSAAALEALVGGGVNRISVGVQALDDPVLRLLGRRHDARTACKALALVRDAGVELSVDLICGVPGQTMASWVESLEEVIEVGARHVSVYPLALEEGTPLAAAVNTGLVPDVDPDLAADMMLAAERRLGLAGIARYEVANYAAPGHESRHNTAYWTGRSYIGIGPGAHGMLEPDVARTVGLLVEAGQTASEVARVRYASSRELASWLACDPGEVELLSADEMAREDVMLGMRLTRGVGDARVVVAGLAEVLRALEADGLVELDAGRWRATERGWLLGNEVFGRIWAGE
jgi:oxygen-independent coproporphyrinogen III oxidase